MRSLIIAVLSSFAASLSAAVAIPTPSRTPQVLEYDIEAPKTTFTIPCPSSSACAGADVVFELQLSSSDYSTKPNLTLNNRVLDVSFLDWSSGSLLARSTFGAEHLIHYSLTAHSLKDLAGHVIDRVYFRAESIDSVDTTALGFAVHVKGGPAPYFQFLHIVSIDEHNGVVSGGLDFDFASVSESFKTSSPVLASIKKGDEMASSKTNSSFDIEAELEALALLDVEATNLKQEIIAKKQAIAQHLKEHRDHVGLRHLLKECNGLICAARVIAQRIGDKVGVIAEPSLGYARLQNPHLQHLISFEDESVRPQQTSRNCTKSKTPVNIAQNKHTESAAQGLNVPFTVTKNASSSEYRFEDLVSQPNPLLRALGIIASILGLITLFKFIRRRCMSMRKRVERAADREERRNARAYRKAARRAEMRRRWDHFVNAFNCFRPAPEPRMEDYEEKRALILQDAFLEQLGDLDQAEKGEIMEAEIRELKMAHDIVTSLVRVDEHRQDLMELVNDPPPPRVPLPFTPESRSRASTHTLPSYTSESLPDYSSRPETLNDSSLSDSLVDGFTNYTPPSETEGRHTPQSITSSGRIRYTPESSIVDCSTRASEETLRTRQSKDTSNA